MILNSSFHPRLLTKAAFAIVALVATSALFSQRSAAQTAPLTPDIPRKFETPTSSYDYVKRDVMIPMRDGVKLHTVIVIPRGREECADDPDAHAVQRVESDPAEPVAAHAGDPAAGR